MSDLSDCHSTRAILASRVIEMCEASLKIIKERQEKDLNAFLDTFIRVEDKTKHKWYQFLFGKEVYLDTREKVRQFFEDRPHPQHFVEYKIIKNKFVKLYDDINEILHLAKMNSDCPNIEITADDYWAIDPKLELTS
jgi:hypothetical protein